MNAKTAFMGVAMLLVALVIGVPVLTAIFATSGPFGQLQGVAEGTCDWSPTTGLASDAVPPPLARGFTIPDGVTYSTVALPTIAAEAAKPAAGETGYGWIAQAPTGSGTVVPSVNVLTINIDDSAYALGTGNPNLSQNCNAAGDDIAAVPYPALVNDAYVIGNAASVSDAQLSDNPYAGILTAAILLIPLAIVAFFAFRFFRERF